MNQTAEHDQSVFISFIKHDSKQKYSEERGERIRKKAGLTTTNTKISNDVCKHFNRVHLCLFCAVAHSESYL